MARSISKILLFVSFLLSILEHQTALGLPDGCTKTGDEVTCIHLLSFPRDLESDCSTLTISTSKFDEIPSGAFAGLTNLKNLTITTVGIGTIRACAFASLNNIKVINIDTSKIDTIESDAFINITGSSGGKMSLHLVSLGTIRPYAFNNIVGFDHFSVDLATIASVQSYAFYNIKPTMSFAIHRVNITDVGAGAFQMIDAPSVDFYSSTIYRLGCETYDKLYTGNISPDPVPLSKDIGPVVSVPEPNWMWARLKNT